MRNERNERGVAMTALRPRLRESLPYVQSWLRRLRELKS